MPLLPAWAVPPKEGNMWRERFFQGRPTGGISLFDLALFVALGLLVFGSPGLHAHATTNPEGATGGLAAPAPGPEAVVPFLAKPPTYAVVAAPAVVSLTDLFTVSPFAALEIPTEGKAHEPRPVEPSTEASGSPPPPPPPPTGVKREDSPGAQAPRGNTAAVPPFLKLGLAAAAASGLSETLRRLGVSPELLKVPDPSGTSGVSPSSSESPSTSAPQTTTASGVDTAVQSGPSGQDAAVTVVAAEQRDLRPSPRAYPVPVPVPYFPVMYPGLAAVPVAPVVSYPGGRYAVPPPFPLSPPVAGPTLPPQVPGFAAVALPGVPVGAPVGYGVLPAVPATVTVQPAVAAMPAQQVTVTVPTYLTALPAVATAVAPAAR
ncbi:hypothetical protein BESB_002810 [Besnoitia besnoiti]|uniref:Uncharacterized protein n=1 Tax=Besnoitia besnoiti TaxID=94643 RepID=A0A2A9MPW7_BESBE|nr:hypothetical protein BESB_002810 [Besnoitia besnoiti]PFH37940.1 hypothetical protein BESB_002810 [Besnoitia besnoiti]